MDNQFFEVEIDGNIKSAKVLQVIEMDDQKYILYTINENDETAEIYASKLETEEDGTNILVDIEDEEIRANVFEVADILLEDV